AGWLLAAPGKNPSSAHSKANRRMVMDGVPPANGAVGEEQAGGTGCAAARSDTPRTNSARTIARGFCGSQEPKWRGAAEKNSGPQGIIALRTCHVRRKPAPSRDECQAAAGRRRPALAR